MADGRTVVCCPQTSFWLEKWPGDPFPQNAEDVLFSLPVGYDGFSALFVPTRTLAKYPLATSYNAYKFLPEYKNIFPAAFSTPCNETLQDPAGGCVDSNRWCAIGEDPGLFNTTKCVQGRYVPPQCVGNPSCQEIYHASPIWDTGYFEAVIRNLKLNFTIVYFGIDR
jgi:hypothetical protein